MHAAAIRCGPPTTENRKKSYTSPARRASSTEGPDRQRRRRVRLRGYLTAYDPKTGKQVCAFYTVPGPESAAREQGDGDSRRKTWHCRCWLDWGAAATVWDYDGLRPGAEPAVYRHRQRLAVVNYKFRSDGKGDNLFLSSIVALDADTGEYAWHYQTTPADQWDYTATQHILLAELSIDGQPRKVLMQAPKNGFFYVIDRTNGKLISAKNFVPINWATHVDLATGRPVVTPEGNYLAGPKVVVPSFLGAHNWQPMSFNPKTGYVYLPAQESVAGLQAQDKPMFIPHKSVVNLGVEVPDLPEDPKIEAQIRSAWKGRLIAWDPVKQAPAWTQEYVAPWNGGTLSTAGNLVFQGTADGRAVAYAADSGKKLWDASVNSGSMAGPVTYEVDGEQYVTFMAGWGGAFPLVTGPLSLSARVQPEARIVTFKLGAKGKLPPAKKAVVALPPLQKVTAGADELKQARTMFNGFCGSCHGLNAVSGGVLPDLRYLTPVKHEQYVAVLSGAKLNRGMPSFASVLGPKDMELIRQYIVKRSHDLQEQLKLVPVGTAPAK